MKTTLMAFAVAIMCCGGQAEAGEELSRKKLIEWGWDEPNTKFIRENIQRMEQFPFDGLVFHVLSNKGGQLMWHMWGQRKFEIDEFQHSMENLKATKFRRFTDRFLRVNVTPGKVDWFDDRAWSVVEHNIGVAAQIAKQGRCKGFMFDVEQYQSALFDYREQPQQQNRSFAQYRAKVRERGRQWIQAVNREFPEITILLTFGYAMAQPTGEAKNRSAARYGLLADFLDGMIEACTENTSIVDAWEYSYPYKQERQFEEAYKTIKAKSLNWTSVPKKYQRHIRAGFGIWMDYDWRHKGWDVMDFSKNYFTPNDFERSVRAALRVSDQYVWIYTEKPKWWTDELLPKAYIEAVANARQPRRVRADDSPDRGDPLINALVKQLTGKLPRYALEFDGQNSYVTVPSLHYDGSYPITIEAIVTPDKIDSVIVADTQRAGVGIGFWGDKYNVHAWNGRKYDVALSDKAAVLYLRVHIAGIFDGKKVSVFVNGKLQQIAPKLDGEFKASRFPMTIGASPSPRDSGCDFPFTGVIEAVHISKRVRYTKDFKPSYKFQADKDTLALFRFDEGKGNTASDSSGNKHHGTLKGAKWVTDVAIRHRAAQGLAQIGRPALPALIEALDHENRDVRVEAVWALGQIGPDAKPVVPALNRALKDKDERVRNAAATAIKRIPPQVSPLATLDQKRGTVATIAFSPDGRLMLTGADNGKVWVRELRSGKVLRKLRGHTGITHRSAFAPDGKTFATGSFDKTIRLWNVETGESLATLSDHARWNMSLAFSPNGKLLAAGSRDGTVQLWDVATKKVIRVLPAQPLWVTGVDFSPDGKLLATSTGSWEAWTIPGELKLWDVLTGKELATLPGHQRAIWCVKFSPDGKLIAAPGSDRTIRVWDAATFKVRMTLRTKSSVQKIVFLRDRQLLVSGETNGDVALWNLRTASQQIAFESHTHIAHQVGCSPDGTLIASAALDGLVKLSPTNLQPLKLPKPQQHTTAEWVRRWDIGVRVPQAKLKWSAVVQPKNTGFVAASPDFKLLAVGSDNKTVKLLDATTGIVLKTLAGHTEKVLAGAFSPDGKTLATAGWDNQLKLWNVETGKERMTLLGHRFHLGPVLFTPTGDMLISGDGNGVIKLWSPRRGKEVATIRQDGFGVVSMAISPNGRLLATGNDPKTIWLWDLVKDKRVGTLDGHPRRITALAFSPDGTALVSACACNDPNRTLTRWDVKTRQERFALKGHTGHVHAVAFSPNGKLLASGGSDHSIRFWDWETGTQLTVINEAHQLDVMDLAFSPDGQQFVSVSLDGEVKMWNMDNGTLLVRRSEANPE